MTHTSFVTGGTGFIGSFLVRRLLSNGHKVRLLTRDREKAKSLFGIDIEIVKGDITDTGALREGTNGADFVFHLAARVGDFGPKREFYRVNVDGTKSLVDAARKAKLNRFIYVSTNAVTGMKRQEITDESTPYSNTGGHYGISKGMAERITLESYEKDGLPGVIIRPAIVYGPGSTNFVIRPFESMKKGKMFLLDGGRGLCWHTYVENLIDAIMLSSENEKAIGEIFIITDGKSDTTWGEYFNKLSETAGFPPISRDIPKWLAMTMAWSMYGLYRVSGIKPMIAPMAVGIITSRSGVSIEKAKKVLGYSPGIDLDKGMRRVGEWLKKEGLI